MVFTSSEITCKWVWTEKQSHFLPVVSVLCKSLHQISFWTLGIKKTDSAFSSVLCLLGEAVNSAGNGQWHVWEGSSRKAVEGQNISIYWGIWELGCLWKVCVAQLTHPCQAPVFWTGGAWWDYTLGSQSTVDTRYWKLYFSFLEPLWDNTGACELKSLIKVSSPG